MITSNSDSTGSVDSADTSTWGLPQSDSPAPFGLNTEWVYEQMSPAINGIDEIWNDVKSGAGEVFDDASMVISNAPQDVVNGVKGVYNFGMQGVDAVVTDTTNILTKPLNQLMIYVVVGLVVVGGVIYFAGKSGALRVNAIV